MKKLKILLTFDYELPLGEAKDYQHALFKPAGDLIQLANQLNVPIVLFTDICSALRFKEWDPDRYFIPFKNQIQGALRDGHDIQLHIHPHWMTSDYRDEAFLPSSDYSLSNFSTEKSGFTIERIITSAFQELTFLCKEADPDYECVAFRAGGYDVEPESKRILTKLHDLGVRLESSVIKDLYLDFNFSHIDYSDTPSSSQWFISRQGPLHVPSSNDLLELPVSSRPVQVSDIIVRRIKKMLNSGLYKSRVYNNRGKGFLAIQGTQSLTSRIRKIFNPIVLSLDKEYLDCKDLESIVDYNIEKYKDEAHDLIVTVIGHPKSMGNYHLGLMEQFVGKMKARFGDDVSFVTYRDLKNIFF